MCLSFNKFLFRVTILTLLHYYISYFDQRLERYFQHFLFTNYLHAPSLSKLRRPKSKKRVMWCVICMSINSFVLNVSNGLRFDRMYTFFIYTFHIIWCSIVKLFPLYLGSKIALRILCDLL